MCACACVWVCWMRAWWVLSYVSLRRVDTGRKESKSGGQNQKWPTSVQGGYMTPAAWGVHPLQSGEQNQRWPTSGQGGYITPAA